MYLFFVRRTHDFSCCLLTNVIFPTIQNWFMFKCFVPDLFLLFWSYKVIFICFFTFLSLWCSVVDQYRTSSSCAQKTLLLASVLLFISFHHWLFSALTPISLFYSKFGLAPSIGYYSPWSLIIGIGVGPEKYWSPPTLRNWLPKSNPYLPHDMFQNSLDGRSQAKIETF